MEREPALPVVVAIDDAGSADEAVDWAAAEAAAQHRPLRVVHVLTVPLSVDPCATGAVIGQVGTERDRARTTLSRALARANAVASDIEVTTALLDGPTPWALQREARTAAELVLGLNPRRTGLRSWLTESVSGHLVTSAACPVIVIRPRRQGLRTAPTVVVGLDAGPAGSAALRFAFGAAAQRGIPLTVLHSTAVADVLAHGRRHFPGVDVRVRSVFGNPATELATASTGAALLVLGPPGRRRFPGRPASVGRQLLADADCPVAIVRTGRGTKHPRPYGKLVSWTASSGGD